MTKRILAAGAAAAFLAAVLAGGLSVAAARSRVHAAVDSAALAAAYHMDPVVVARIEPKDRGGVARTYTGPARKLPGALRCRERPAGGCRERVASVQLLRWEPDKRTARVVVQKILDETLGAGRYRIDRLEMTTAGRVTLEVTAAAPTPLARFLGPLGRVKTVGEVESRWAGEGATAS